MIKFGYICRQYDHVTYKINNMKLYNSSVFFHLRKKHAPDIIYIYVCLSGSFYNSGLTSSLNNSDRYAWVLMTISWTLLTVHDIHKSSRYTHWGRDNDNADITMGIFKLQVGKFGYDFSSKIDRLLNKYYIRTFYCFILSSGGDHLWIQITSTFTYRQYLNTRICNLNGDLFFVFWW